MKFDLKWSAAGVSITLHELGIRKLELPGGAMIEGMPIDTIPLPAPLSPHEARELGAALVSFAAHAEAAAAAAAADVARKQRELEAAAPSLARRPPPD